MSTTTHQGAVGAEKTAGKIREALKEIQEAADDMLISLQDHWHDDATIRLTDAAADARTVLAAAAQDDLYDLSTPAPRTDGGMTAGQTAFSVFYDDGEIKAWPNISQAGRDRWDRVAAAVLASATPAQPAGAVPDGVREAIAELEKATFAYAKASEQGAQPYSHARINVALARAREKALDWALSLLAEPTANPESWVEAMRRNEAGTPCISAHPAGQSTASEPDPTLIYWIESNTERLCNLYPDAASSIVEFREELVGLMEGDPAGQSTGQGAEPIAVVQALRDTDWSGASIGNKLLIAAAIDALEALTAQLRATKPAPDSTRTGPVGTDHAQLISDLMDFHDALNGGVGNGAITIRCESETEQTRRNFRAVLREAAAALAARPAAPEAQGAWSRRDAAVAALKNVHAIVCEAAMTGFNCHDGDWAERLFRSQQQTSEAIRAFEPGYRWSQPAPPSSGQEGA